MPVPAWVTVYTVVILLGLIAGLLLRYILTVVIVTTIVVVLGIWLLGLLDASALSQLPTLTGRLMAGLPIGPQVLFTVGAAVFLTGAFVGLLLTTRIRAFDRARPS
jgi:hypothetical protein